ncbi:MAG: neuraminidase-like domain-containing protein [Eubacteriales bacterium]|nr:neuraminidase-like domain-containing protein [Eubacteriales bacterium]
MKDDTRGAQRLQQLGAKKEFAGVCTEAGYDSALKITAVSRGRFVQDTCKMAEHSVLTADMDFETMEDYREHMKVQALNTYEAARKKKNEILTAWAAIHGLTAPSSKALHSNSAGNQVAEIFEKLPDYQEIFGNLDYEQQGEAGSILGPVAYFTDLMRVVKNYVEEPNIKTVSGQMQFSVRRADLLQLPLTNENADTVIPYIRIVNERLGDILREEYPDEKARILAMADHIWPLSAPVNLFLEKIRACFRQKNDSLAHIYRVMEAGEKACAMELLGLSAEEWTVLTDGSEIKPEILKYKGAKDSQEYRLLYLKEKLGWDYKRLFWALYCVTKGNPVLTEEALKGLAALADLAQRLDVKPWECLPLIFDLKTGSDFSEEETDYSYEGIFCTKDFQYRPQYARNPEYKDSILIWKASEENTAFLAAIASGLSLPQMEAEALMKGIFGSSAELTVQNLSLLYAHSILLRRFSMDTAQYLLLLKIIKKKDALALDTGTIGCILEVVQLLKKNNTNVYELDYVMNGQDSPYLDPGYREETVESWFVTLPGLLREGGQNAQVLEQLAVFLEMSPEEMETAWILEGSPDLENIFRQVPGVKNEAAKELIHRLSQKRLLLEKLSVDGKLAGQIMQNKASYGMELMPECSLEELENLSELTQLLKIYKGQREKLLTFIETGDDEKAAEALSGLTGTLTEDARRFLEMHLNTVRVKQLSIYTEVCTLEGKLGIQPGVMKKILLPASCNLRGGFDQWQEAAELSQAVLCADYKDQAKQELLHYLDQQEEYTKRTPLMVLAIDKLGRQEETKWIQNAKSLYEYILIDPLMGESATTTYIREGISAAQLYLQRCRESLEPGIKEFEIPDIWWEWLMDYRTWEANRKVFLYPENYLEPDQRSSKTELFGELENILKQGEATSETVENAYREYLESLAGLGKMSIVEACYSEVSDETKSNSPTLFIFARTQTQPYTYYHIELTEEGVWSEWKKLDISISADDISAVYAFNRLFVFWLEITKNTQTTEGGNKDVITTKADLHYSFYNFSGKWVQPQILTKDMVIASNKHYEDYGGLLPNGLFDPETDCWKKVYPMCLPRNSYYHADGTANREEKLVIFYGPWLDAQQSWKQPAVLSKPEEGDAFAQMRYHAACCMADMKKGGQTGLLPVFPPAILNDNLEKGFLVKQEEYLYISKDPAGNGVNRSMRTDRSSGELFLYPADSVVAKNYIADDSYIADSKDGICMGDGMRDKEKVVFPVKNHTKSWIFRDNKETFLILAGKKDMAPINKNVINSGIILDEHSFVSKGAQIDEALSKKFYEELIARGYLYEDGRAVEGTEFADLKNIIKDMVGILPQQVYKISVIINRMMEMPKFYTDSFCSENKGVDMELSKRVYQQLLDMGCLDQEGRLDSENDFRDVLDAVGQIMQGQPEEKEKTHYITDVLFQSMEGVGIVYFNKASKEEKGEYQAIRLSTAAIHRLSHTLMNGGIKNLLALKSQQAPEIRRLPYRRLGLNSEQIIPPQVQEGDQVDFAGPYGAYYWEVFFHGPLYMYSLLKDNRKFKEAEDWIKFVFNPTAKKELVTEESFVNSQIGIRDSRWIYKILVQEKIVDEKGQVREDFSEKTDIRQLLGIRLTEEQIASVYYCLENKKLNNPYGYLWQFAPFRNHTLESMLEQLQNPQEIAAYNAHPFDPHAIARLRIGAYEKNVAMKYADNLLEWGDSLFTQFTWESVTSAVMLYTYAWNLLGERPSCIGSAKKRNAVTFAEIYEKYQKEIPQFLIELEHLTGQKEAGAPGIEEVPINVTDTYFAVPENQAIMSYWDRIEDRLFKIRNGFNIDGTRQELSLYGTPIDLNQLTHIAASGGNVLSVLNQGADQLLPYRFSSLLENAKGMVQILNQLGTQLLAALEKQDGEELLALRSVQERILLDTMTYAKEQQAEEARKALEALNKGADSVSYRKDYYKQLYYDNLSALETDSVDMMYSALSSQKVAMMIRGVAVAGYLAPNIFGFAAGGMQFGDAVSMGAQVAEGVAGVLTHTANTINTVAQYERRREEWENQRKLAEYEEQQITEQKKSINARIAALEQEVLIHEKNISQAREYAEFLEKKFTGQELYRWMQGRLSSLYYQTYRLALQAALQAQNTYQNELACDDRFITYDYFDSLKKGLLAGEGLLLSLGQMEKAYLEKSRRELEIEKTVSLLHLNPEGFLNFKWGGAGIEKGELHFALSEKLFDFDYPGHYLRRIKSVSVTIPAVAGPYQNIHATLTQESSMIVMKPDSMAVRHALEPDKYEAPAGTVRENWMSGQKIAVSKGMDDNGLFVLDFKDERYLPFECSGAVSRWVFRMPPETNRIDFDSISDIILTVRYTAREADNPEFERQVKEYLRGQHPPYPLNLYKCMDLKQAYYGAWKKGMEEETDGRYRFAFSLTDEKILPNLKDCRIRAITIMLKPREGNELPETAGDYVRLDTGKEEMKVEMHGTTGNAPMSGSACGEECAVLLDSANAPEELLTEGKITEETLKTIVIVLEYESNVF